jgi:hypothetical protein
MAQSVDGRRLRSHFTRPEWEAPRPYGPDGWMIHAADDRASVIISAAEWVMPGGRVNTWVHASISRRGELPSYSDLTLLKLAVWGEDGEAYQVFAPLSQHVNIHPTALHLWGVADGRGMLPRFGALGTI